MPLSKQTLRQRYEKELTHLKVAHKMFGSGCVVRNTVIHDNLTDASAQPRMIDIEMLSPSDIAKSTYISRYLTPLRSIGPHLRIS
jgi:hypothetical protein